MASSLGEKELAFIKAQLEEKYDFGPVEDWTSYHYTQVSDDIQANTKHSLSTSTLQRMLGKKGKAKAQYHPQIHTRNSLAQYLGFKNWNELSLTVHAEPPTHTNTKQYLPWLLLVSLLLIGLITLIISYATPQPIPKLRIVNPTDTVPFTLKVAYSAQGSGEGINLNFNDGLPPAALKKDKRILTHYFTKAGYSPIYLQEDSNKLEGFPIHRLSTGWQLSYIDNLRQGRYVVLKDGLYLSPDTPLYFSKDTLQRLGTPYQKDPWIVYTLAERFPISLDSIRLEVEALNTPEIGGKSCYDILLRLSGEQGNIEFRIVDKKCQHYASVELSEQRLSGVYDDLESLTNDMQQWQQIGLKVQNQQMQISLNGKPLLTQAYQRLMGPLKAIEIEFYGNGKFQNLRYQGL